LHAQRFVPCKVDDDLTVLLLGQVYRFNAGFCAFSIPNDASRVQVREECARRGTSFVFHEKATLTRRVLDLACLETMKGKHVSFGARL
jgi:hypothetical protein